MTVWFLSFPGHCAFFFSLSPDDFVFLVIVRGREGERRRSISSGEGGGRIVGIEAITRSLFPREGEEVTQQNGKNFFPPPVFNNTTRSFISLLFTFLHYLLLRVTFGYLSVLPSVDASRCIRFPVDCDFQFAHIGTTECAPPTSSLLFSPRVKLAGSGRST